jgi:type II restriction enzyme
MRPDLGFVDLSFDRLLGEPYHSASQLARVLTQGWVEREVYCLNCGSGPLEQTTQNTKAMDFRCAKCREPYELKSSKRPFGHYILDGEYSTFLGAIQSHDNPNLLLLNYDAEKLEVTDLQALSRYALSRMAVVPRKPLGPTARRAGWQGCTIDLTGLGRSAFIPIVVEGGVRPRPHVLDDWRQLDFFKARASGARDWLPDIMSSLRRIQSETFTLDRIYAFEKELRLLHPKNMNIQPKIRQLLQILVRQGLLERLTPGRYRKTLKFW